MSEARTRSPAAPHRARAVLELLREAERNLRFNPAEP